MRKINISKENDVYSITSISNTITTIGFKDGIKCALIAKNKIKNKITKTVTDVNNTIHIECIDTDIQISNNRLANSIKHEGVDLIE